MKKNWEVKKLYELCDNYKKDIVDGPFGSNLKRCDYISDGVPVLKIQNVKENYIDLKNMDYVSAEKFNKLRRHSYKSGDIVMTKLGKPLGLSAIVDILDEGLIVADLVRIRASKIDTKFLCYYLNSNKTRYYINSKQKGTTRPRIRLSIVREVLVPVPPLSEQKRIVAILDEAFAAIAKAKENTEKNLQNAREVFESYLESVFANRGEGWEEKKLGEAIESNVIGLIKRVAEQGPNKKYKYFKMNNITNDNCLYLDDMVHVDATRQEVEKYSLRNGDFLFNTRNSFELVGKYCVYNNENEGPVIYNNNIMRIRFKKDILSCFISYSFSNRSTNKLLDNMKSGTTNVSAIYFKNLSVMPIKVPSVKEQQRIVAKLDNLSAKTKKLEVIYTQKLDDLEELKKSILQKAFDGEL